MPVLSEELEQGFASIKAKQWHISLGQNATSSQVKVMAILDYVTSFLKKKLVKEQSTICTDSKAVITARVASGTKSLFVTDCMKKLTVMSEENQIIKMWLSGHCRMERNETVDRLARVGARIKLMCPEAFLPLPLSKYRTKIRN